MNSTDFLLAIAVTKSVLYLHKLDFLFHFLPPLLTQIYFMKNSDPGGSKALSASNRHCVIALDRPMRASGVRSAVKEVLTNAHPIPVIPARYISFW